MTRDTFKAKGTTIESSDSVALRARLLAHVSTLRHLPELARREWKTKMADDMQEAIAALSMPASEAVAWRWRHPDGEVGRTWWNMDDTDHLRRMRDEEGCAIEYAYPPPPAPAAHAGGDVVTTVSHSEYVAALGKWKHVFYTQAEVKPRTPLYTHPSPMPVDALRELATQLASDAECKGLSAGYRSACGHIHNQLAALLSGGAAREE